MQGYSTFSVVGRMVRGSYAHKSPESLLVTVVCNPP